MIGGEQNEKACRLQLFSVDSSQEGAPPSCPNW